MISNKNRITESASTYNNLELMSTHDILVNINNEDKSIPLAIEKAIPQIENLVNALVEKLNSGGRLFYMGAGTSGRLGIVDASECPPTYGVPHGMVIGIIAGGINPHDCGNTNFPRVYTRLDHPEIFSFIQTNVNLQGNIFVKRNLWKDIYIFWTSYNLNLTF